MAQKRKAVAVARKKTAKATSSTTAGKRIPAAAARARSVNPTANTTTTGSFNVLVTVSEPEPRVVFLGINPERVQLNGKGGDTITWRLTGGGEFQSASDIKFVTSSGRGRFQVAFDSPNQITATVNGEEENQTIYTYLITVHFPEYNVALSIDPEVDNPPPPPT